MIENPNFDIKKEPSATETIKIHDVKYVIGTLNYKWFNYYTPEEFKKAAYIKDKKGNKYYWGQGVILKP